jgi:Arrestin (or S-antigen), N-terminal domain
MAAVIHVDKPHAYFTNLDPITGKVILQLNSDTSISSINVKLEGVAHTRLVGPRHPGGDVFDKTKTEFEIHKVRGRYHGIARVGCNSSHVD